MENYKSKLKRSPLVISFLCCALLSTTITNAGIMAKFKKTKTINLAPFADQTIGLFGQLDFGVARDYTIHLRKYMKEPDANMERLVQLEDHLMVFLKGILVYSLKIWELSEKPVPEEGKSKTYATYIDQLARDLMKRDQFSVNLSEEDYQEILGYIGEQTKFVKALEGAGPLLDQFDTITRTVIQETAAKSLLVANTVAKRIDEDYAHLMMVHNEVQSLKSQILEVLKLIQDYYKRDKQVLEKIQKHPLLARRDFAKFNPVNSKNIRVLDAGLVKELYATQDLLAKLRPDYEDYFKSHEELQNVIDLHDKEVKEASMAIIVWSRAHRTMASGKVNPAEWFDLTNTKALVGLGKKFILP